MAWASNDTVHPGELSVAERTEACDVFNPERAVAVVQTDDCSSPRSSSGGADAVAKVNTADELTGRWLSSAVKVAGKSSVGGGLGLLLEPTPSEDDRC